MSRTLKDIRRDLALCGHFAPHTEKYCECDHAGEDAQFHSNECPVGAHARTYAALKLELQMAESKTVIFKVRRVAVWWNAPRFSVNESIILLLLHSALMRGAYGIAAGCFVCFLLVVVITRRKP